MSIEDRAEAVAKNIEGKVQAAMGEMTGSEKDKIEGHHKQDQAAALHLKEDIKDKAKEIVEQA
ncbi:hypothetical protein Cri9333_3512 [Crinalium epipsammum PCC 9333]|uniref:CsbD family protein n=1 Tax=Crinalium epipsammum PCC 9333 TaxID=1173022 RepID=K9W3K7_9CYAN|nr:hypothetical protein [Crinalium epipsammum]AFZ14337.1 hypothetical protein Cri9333_3512 [Crinalium epipsammum PCC 9333]